MAYGLWISVSNYSPFAHHVACFHVQIFLDQSKIARLADITIHSDINAYQFAGVFRTLLRFFEGEQFRSINFETGEMMVEQTEKTGEVLLVPSDSGNLREDGVVEVQYPIPHK